MKNKELMVLIAGLMSVAVLLLCALNSLTETALFSMSVLLIFGAVNRCARQSTGESAGTAVSEREKAKRVVL